MTLQLPSPGQTFGQHAGDWNNNDTELYTLYTLLGIAVGAIDFGTFTGSLLSNNKVAKVLLQELETAIESNDTDITALISNDVELYTLYTLLGVATGATDFGTFTGGILSDNEEAKALFQELEVAIEANDVVIAALVAAVATKVSLTGDESISGIKTFLNDIIINGKITTSEIDVIHSTDPAVKIESTGAGESTSLLLKTAVETWFLYTDDQKNLNFLNNTSNILKLNDDGLTISGGIYLGGSATENLIDDKDEGIYTVTVTPVTSGSVTLLTTEQTASFIKIGNKVHVQGIVEVDSVSSPVGILNFSLPFTAAVSSQSSDFAVGAAASFNVDFDTAKTLINTLISPGSSSFTVLQSGDGGAWGNLGGAAATLKAGDKLGFGFSYIAA